MAAIFLAKGVASSGQLQKPKNLKLIRSQRLQIWATDVRRHGELAGEVHFTLVSPPPSSQDLQMHISCVYFFFKKYAINTGNVPHGRSMDLPNTLDGPRVELH